MFDSPRKRIAIVDINTTSGTFETIPTNAREAVSTVYTRALVFTRV